MKYLMRKNNFCKVVGVTTMTVNRWIKEGMPFIKISNGISLINVEEAKCWMLANGKGRNEDEISIKEAAGLVNVYLGTIRYWKKHDPTFADVLIEGKTRFTLSKTRLLDWLRTKEDKKKGKRNGVDKNAELND